jgi:hypothetical protein
MDSVEQTPTQPLDYAVLNATYGSLLATLVVATRARRLEREPIAPAEWLPLAAATFALSKVIVDEKVVAWVRAPFLTETPAGSQPKGSGIRYAVGELLSCTRCMGAWASLGIVGLRLGSPPAGRALTAVLAMSAANDFLHSAFSLLCAKTNELESR